MPVKLDVPSPWGQFLVEVNQSFSSPIEIHCSGGFVLTVLYGIPRTTSDLDYISTVPNSAAEKLQTLAGPGSQLARKYKVHFQHAGGVTDLPEDYPQRLVSLKLGLSKLTLKVLDPYDLVLSKLTRNSPKDREDVRAIAAKLNLSFLTLKNRFDQEMRPWVANAERHELTLTIWGEYFKDFVPTKQRIEETH